MGAIQAPSLSLAALSPLLFVFGAAAIGVLVGGWILSRPDA